MTSIRERRTHLESLLVNNHAKVVVRRIERNWKDTMLKWLLEELKKIGKIKAAVCMDSACVQFGYNCIESIFTV